MSVIIDYKNITAKVVECDRIFPKHQFHLLYTNITPYNL